MLCEGAKCAKYLLFFVVYCSLCVLETPCARCGCWAIHNLTTVVGTRVLWMSCRDARACQVQRMASGQSANPCWCVARVVVVRSRGAFVVVLVRCFGEVDIMNIRQHSSSSASGSRVGRPTLNTVSRSAKFVLRETLVRVIRVASPSSLSCPNALAGLSIHQCNNPTLRVGHHIGLHTFQTALRGR